MNKEKGEALLEFLTPEDASAALSFDGRSFFGSILKIRRPKDFIDVAVRNPSHSSYSQQASYFFTSFSRSNWSEKLIFLFEDKVYNCKYVESLSLTGFLALSSKYPRMHVCRK